MEFDKKQITEIEIICQALVENEMEEYGADSGFLYYKCRYCDCEAISIKDTNKFHMTPYSERHRLIHQEFCPYLSAKRILEGLKEYSQIKRKKDE